MEYNEIVKEMAYEILESASKVDVHDIGAAVDMVNSYKAEEAAKARLEARKQKQAEMDKAFKKLYPNGVQNKFEELKGESYEELVKEIAMEVLEAVAPIGLTGVYKAAQQAKQKNGIGLSALGIGREENKPAQKPAGEVAKNNDNKVVSLNDKVKSAMVKKKEAHKAEAMEKPEEAHKAKLKDKAEAEKPMKAKEPMKKDPRVTPKAENRQEKEMKNVKKQYKFDSLDGSVNPDTGREDGKPVNKEEFYKRLIAQNREIDRKRNAG